MENNLLDQVKKATEHRLSKDFITELIKCCLINSKILNICKQHLKFHYLHTEAQKLVVRYVYEYSELQGVAPTPGLIAQAYPSDKEVISLLAQVKKAEILPENHDQIITSFEAFIRKSKFLALYTKVGELFNQGKQEEAIQVMDRESLEIAEFQLKEDYYDTVFKGFEERQAKRKLERDNILLTRCPFGIHELDDITRGGVKKGTSALFLASSGVGKSTVLRWIGLCNARLGFRVVHIQAEGTKKEVMDVYDAGWTGIPIHDMEMGDIPIGKADKIRKAHSDLIRSGGEIYVKAVESFDSITINECRDFIVDIEKNIGKVDVVIFDYLELFGIKGKYYNSDSGERKRREDLANKITNIATEFKVACITATQSVDLEPDKLNNEKFVMTRHHVAEFKGILRPFSYFITLNQTPDEYENEIIRLYIDKLRGGKKPKEAIRIYQSRSNGRFYDSRRTVETFYRKVA